LPRVALWILDKVPKNSWCEGLALALSAELSVSMTRNFSKARLTHAHNRTYYMYNGALQLITHPFAACELCNLGRKFPPDAQRPALMLARRAAWRSVGLVLPPVAARTAELKSMLYTRLDAPSRRLFRSESIACHFDRVVHHLGNRSFQEQVSARSADGLMDAKPSYRAFARVPLTLRGYACNLPSARDPHATTRSHRARKLLRRSVSSPH
jgi:hypothetical protein